MRTTTSPAPHTPHVPTEVWWDSFEERAAHRAIARKARRAACCAQQRCINSSNTSTVRSHMRKHPGTRRK